MTPASTANPQHASGEPSTAVRIPVSEPARSSTSPALSIAATPHSVAGPAPAAPTLAELDEHLAADLDQMLQGNFESIDAVLDEVFEEKAAIVQRTDGSPALENKSQQGGGFAPVTPPDHEIARPFALQEQGSLQQQESSAPEPMLAPAQSNQAALDRNKVEQPAAKTELPAESNADRRASFRDAESLTAASIASANPIPAVIDSPAPKATARQLKAVMTSARTSAVNTLMVVNFPMRFVPRSLRPLVDWAALTLLLWVPIVWVMVFLNRGHDGESSGHEDSATLLHASSLRETPHVAADEAR